MIVHAAIGNYLCHFDEEDWILYRAHPMTVKTKPGGYKVLVFGRGSLCDKIVSRVIMSAPAGILVDHRDGDTLNVVRDNLRFATRQQNAANSVGMSGRNLPKGVTNNGNNYGAQITVNGKRIWLGTFVSCDNAEKAYQRAADHYFGEFALHNSRRSE